MRYLLAIAVLMTFTGPALSQEDEASIYKLWDSFTASSVAYDRCGSNEAAVKHKFEINSMAISAKAAVQAKEDHPFEPDADLANATEARRKAIKTKVEQEIEKNGCASDGIKELLKLYDVNANWNADVK